MKRSIRVLLALAAALAGVLAIGVSNAYANDLCGTTITEDTKLDHDHDCSGSTGITIATPGVTLDLCDYTINGDETAGLHGIIITADDVTVKNGTVSDFIDGISVRDADRVKLKNLWVISNDDDGVNAEESQWLQLYKVRANDNGEEGADIDTGSHFFRISYSEFNDNSDEGVELDGVSDGLVTKSKANRNGLEGFETDANGDGSGGVRVRFTYNVANNNGNDGLGIDDNDGGIVSHNKADSNDPDGSDGFELDDASDMTITHNVATNNSDEGFDIENIDDSLIKKNIAVHNDGDDGFDFKDGSDDNDVLYNKAIDNGDDEGDRGFEFSDSSDGNNIRGNVAKRNYWDGFQWQLNENSAAPAANGAGSGGKAGGSGGSRGLYGAVVVIKKNTFCSNTALHNGDDGFESEQRGVIFKGNVSGKNDDFGIRAPKVVSGGFGYANGANLVFGNGSDPQCSSGVACTVIY